MTDEKKFSRNFCKVIMEGRLVSDPRELRDVGDNKVTTIRIASNTTPKEAVFIDIDCWNGQGQYIYSYARQGTRVLVEGKLAPSRYTGKNREVDTFKIISDSISIIEAPRREETEKEEAVEEVKAPAQKNRVAPPPPSFRNEAAAEPEESTSDDGTDPVIHTADEDYVPEDEFSTDEVPF